QRQDSAVTYVAICVVCAIVIEKHVMASVNTSRFEITLWRQSVPSRSKSPLWRQSVHRGRKARYGVSQYIAFESTLWRQ
ncbi:hypothetical protein CCL07_22630, partial [Pseudomonas congelans]